VIKYFVSFTFPENGRQEFGWATIESNHYFISEHDIIEVTEVLKQREGKDKITVLYFTVMAGPLLGSSQDVYKTN
jgi:hypothetical protein